LSHSRWHILPPPPDGSLSGMAGYTPLITNILFHRGITESSQVEPFLAVDKRLSFNPELLPGISQAIPRIYRALLTGESICIYGDFDTDGVTATALLVEGLSRLGAKVVPYIPHRLNEGYGLKLAALENLCHQGISLVITTDCGITAVEPVEKSKALGIDIIITDHHMPLTEIPKAVAVIDPKLPGSSYPFTELSGAGVALKLLQALYGSLGREEGLSSLMDLVALGTIADMVPLLGENRYLVKKGLELLNQSPRLGITEMLSQAGLKAGSLDSQTISWVIAPRLNAAGRLDHAISSYQLLTTDSSEEAKSLAAWLQNKNMERQDLTTKTFNIARSRIEEQGIKHLLLTSGTEFPVGICGLVASRLAEEFYRPAIVAMTEGDLSRGSCRSVPEFNIIEAMNNFQTFHGSFIQFGGHAQAAGFTILTRDIPRLADYLVELAETKLSGLDLRPRIDIDAEVRLPELGGRVFQTLQKLEPFGQGNPLPSFISRGVEVVESRLMGKGNEHLRLKLKQGGTVWDGVAFGMGGDRPDVSASLDMVYNLEVDHWNGNATLRLNILDFSVIR
jgi:single-stranded-DNA-specific exonuclease